MPEKPDRALRRARLARVAGIYPLADDDPRWRHDVETGVDAVTGVGVSVVQLRFKHLRDGEALALARRCKKLCEQRGVLLFVNDRFDLAGLAAADGVHVGTDDCPPEKIPADVRAQLLVGLSTHTLEQVRAANQRPVDCIGFGPVFGTASKQSEYSARGLDQLTQAARESAHPVVAIGGIGLDQASAVAASGASGAAVISAISQAEDPAEATRELQGAFNQAKP